MIIPCNFHELFELPYYSGLAHPFWTLESLSRCTQTRKLNILMIQAILNWGVTGIMGYNYNVDHYHHVTVNMSRLVSQVCCKVGSADTVLIIMY
jgi:hypothetical protein